MKGVEVELQACLPSVAAEGAWPTYASANLTDAKELNVRVPVFGPRGRYERDRNIYHPCLE